MIKKIDLDLSFFLYNHDLSYTREPRTLNALSSRHDSHSLAEITLKIC